MPVYKYVPEILAATRPLDNSMSLGEKIMLDTSKGALYSEAWERCCVCHGRAGSY